MTVRALSVSTAEFAPESRSDELTVAIETSPDEWTRFLASHPGNGYHDWGWRQVFKEASGYDSIYLAAWRRGEIAGVLPLVFFDSWIFGRSLVSLPFLNYGGVVATDAAASAALLTRATEIAKERRCQYVELRHVERQFDALPCKRHKVTMLFPLVAPAMMWDRLDRKVRNQVRKAQKSELTYETGFVELLDDFYAVFSRNMRDLGTPVYGRRFFERILAAFPTRSALHVVRLGKRAVGAGLTFRTGVKLEMPWASSVRDFNPLCTNHLLYWSVIERASTSGCTLFDFGRSTPDEGTFRFKEQWGAQPVPLCWEYVTTAGCDLPNTSPTNAKFRLAVALWKKLPVRVATQIGPMIVRSIP